MNAMRKTAGIGRDGLARTIILRIFALCIAGYGVWASFDRDMWPKSFLGFSFDLWTPNRASILFYTSNLASCVYVSLLCIMR
jgi:hypothetical protein